MGLDTSTLWDYGKPELSDQRFREALETASPQDALVLQAQIARTYGIRKDFARAREILASIKDQAMQGTALAKVSYLLELGRTYASATHPSELQTPEAKETARTFYMQAFETARQAGIDDLAVDALHMMVTVDTDPKAQLEWNLKAIAYVEGSSQAGAKKWEASLRNNVGYAQHLLGRYDEALTQFRLSLAARERDGNVRGARIAHWMIAWTLRAQAKFQEAIDIQLRLEREWDQAGDPDPYVFEELEHLYRATGDSARAEHYATRLRASRVAE
jgi:tetratricopeptide (TPR) repeat protein